MSVSVKQLRVVADDVQSEHPYIASVLRELSDKREAGWLEAAAVDTHPDALLALGIADASNNGQRMHDLLSEHRDPDKWLFMAAAARKCIDAEREQNVTPVQWSTGEVMQDDVTLHRAPRIFRVGDAEPADRDIIILRGIAKDGASRPKGTVAVIQYGKYGTLGETHWYQSVDRNPTWNFWGLWLELYGPLVEVIQ